MIKQLTFILTVVLVIFLGWYFSLGQSVAESENELKSKIRLEEKKLATYQTVISRLQEHIDTYRGSNIKAIGNKTRTRSNEEEITALYSSFDSLCQKPGYNLHEITPSLEKTIIFLRHEPKTDASYSIPFRIKIDAGFRSLARLIRAIENHRNFDHLSSCHIHGSDRLYPNCALDLSFIASLKKPDGVVRP